MWTGPTGEAGRVSGIANDSPEKFIIAISSIICRCDSSEDRSELSSESGWVARIQPDIVVVVFVEGIGFMMRRNLACWSSSDEDVLSRESVREGILLLLGLLAKSSDLMLKRPTSRRVRGTALIATVDAFVDGIREVAMVRIMAAESPAVVGGMYRR